MTGGFLGNQKCKANNQNCAPCIDTLNVCSGIMTGNVAIEGNKMEYVVCSHGRFFTTKSCAPYNFNRGASICENADNRCNGQANGKYPIQGSDASYVLCYNQNIVEFGSCEPLAFDPKKGSCSKQTSKCTGLTDGKYPTSNNFQYIVCTNGQQTHIGDCSPNTFDSKNSMCIAPEFTCTRMPDGNYGHSNGQRYYICQNGQYRAKDTCEPHVFDFLEGQCLLYPCKGRHTGAYALPGSDIHYVSCKYNEVVSVNQCNNYKFDESLQTCTKSVSFCSGKPNGWHQMIEIFIYMYCEDQKPARSQICPAEVFDVINGVCLEGYMPCKMVTNACNLHYPGPCLFEPAN